jgi:hypothetical protein
MLALSAYCEKETEYRVPDRLVTLSEGLLYIELQKSNPNPNPKCHSFSHPSIPWLHDPTFHLPL